MFNRVVRSFFVSPSTTSTYFTMLVFATKWQFFLEISFQKLGFNGTLRADIGDGGPKWTHHLNIECAHRQLSLSISFSFCVHWFIATNKMMLCVLCVCMTSTSFETILVLPSIVFFLGCFPSSSPSTIRPPSHQYHVRFILTRISAYVHLYFSSFSHRITFVFGAIWR